MMKEPKYRNLAQWVTLGASLFLMVILVIAWISENRSREWRSYQQTLEESPGITEVVLPDLDRIDRCMTCHVHMEEPGMINAALPLAAHSGPYLADHALSKFGCTLCHGGQGRALSREEAHGHVPMNRWSRPLLSPPYLQSSCGKCHLILYNQVHQAGIEGMEILIEGQRIFDREGCLGCHKARRVGGILGPDLTEQGEKSRHAYDFQYVKGEHTVSNWLKEHFRDPEMVSPGSRMLKMDLDEMELEALVTFVMGLARPEIPFDYFDLDALGEFRGIRDPMEGKTLFARACSACHGKRGEGKAWGEFQTGVPSIGGRDFLRTASPEYIRFTLEMGRSMRQMGSWSTAVSGFKPGELENLVDMLKAPGGDPAEALRLMRSVSPDKGRELFRSHCVACHGEDGTGGIAAELNQQDLLHAADDQFLMNTILAGRRNTAMPGFAYLGPGELASIVRYIREWQDRPSLRFQPLVSRAEQERELEHVEEGALNFHYLCSRCHGESGEGGTGPAIINRDFLQAASDRFLFETVARGRAHTAMFGWSSDLLGKEKLEEQTIFNIIAYLRSAVEQPLTYVFQGGNPGDAGAGMELFGKHCATCHGTNGEGIKGPALNNQEFLSAASNGYLLAAITVGRDGTPMPAWGYGEGEYPELSGSERQDLVAAIRSWQRIRIRF